MSAQNGQSVQSDILDAVVAILGGSSVIAGGNAYRCRFSDFGTDELPADNVVPEDEELEYQDTDGIERRFHFKVRHLVAQVDAAEKAADARYIRGVKLLLADITLGGLVRRIKEVGRKWEMEKSELQIVALVVTYEVEFGTTLRDPSVAGY